MLALTVRLAPPKFAMPPPDPCPPLGAPTPPIAWLPVNMLLLRAIVAPVSSWNPFASAPPKAAPERRPPEAPAPPMARFSVNARSLAERVPGPENELFAIAPPQAGLTKMDAPPLLL